jgi:hypothetical protein
MAYKPTGRPVGRPKTKEYVTLLARVPADLAELVKRYASQHGQSVATLIREGVEWRIGDGDPRGMGLYLGQLRDQREKGYYTNTEIALEGESGELLREIQAEQARQGAQLQAVVQALERQTSTISQASVTQHEPTGNVPAPPRTTAADNLQDHLHTTEAPGSEKRQTGNVPEAGGDDTRPAAIPSYDATRFYLGRLCPQRHEYENTGQSLLRRHNQYCRECSRLGKQAARAKRHQVTA